MPSLGSRYRREPGTCTTGGDGVFFYFFAGSGVFRRNAAGEGWNGWLFLTTRHSGDLHGSSALERGTGAGEGLRSERQTRHDGAERLGDITRIGNHQGPRDLACLACLACLAPSNRTERSKHVPDGPTEVPNCGNHLNRPFRRLRAPDCGGQSRAALGGFAAT